MADLINSDFQFWASDTFRSILKLENYSYFDNSSTSILQRFQDCEVIADCLHRLQKNGYVQSSERYLKSYR